MTFRVQSNTKTRLVGLVIGNGVTEINLGGVPHTIRYMRASGNGIQVSRGNTTVSNLMQTFSSYGEITMGYHMNLDAAANVVVNLPSANDSLFIELGRENTSNSVY